MNAQVKPLEPAPAPSTAIAEFSPTEAALADLKQRFGALVVDCATKEGMTIAVKGRAEIRTYRVNLEKKRQDLKADILTRGRLIDGEAKRITSQLEALEEPLDSLIKAEETRKERERAEREAAEAKRVADIHAAIDNVRQIPTMLVGKSSSTIAAALEALRGTKVEAAELQATADDAHARAIAALEQLHAGAVAIENERAERARREEADRLELARLREAEEKRAAAESVRIAEEARARQLERERVEAEQRAAREKIEAEEREARARREEEDRAARARIEEEERAARAKREEADRVAREQREADAQAAEAERQRLAREQAEFDEAERQARKDREAAEARIKAENDRLAGERREVERKAAEVLDARAMLAKFNERFGHVKEFAAVVKAIRAALKVPEAPAPEAGK